MFTLAPKRLGVIFFFAAVKNLVVATQKMNTWTFWLIDFLCLKNGHPCAGCQKEQAKSESHHGPSKAISQGCRYGGRLTKLQFKRRASAGPADA